MTYYDVFNGDADGLCALHQLRLAEPVKSVLVTGVKSDIALLDRVPANAGDKVTVLDISIDANRRPLLAMLGRGAAVLYADHHSNAGIPSHPLLHAVIDTSPDTCTGMIVDQYLGGRFRIWAAVAAFGDNLESQAECLARSLALDAGQTALLQELGHCLNYNAYGDAVSDLNVHPAMLYRCLHQYADPFDFIQGDALFQRIRVARGRDFNCALRLARHLPRADGRIVVLPDAAWSRRVRGIYANHLARASPGQAHALLVQNRNGAYTVSVRAPLEGPGELRGADGLCGQFEGGGGRPAAASIPRLPQQMLDSFVRAFEDRFKAC